MNGQSGQRFLMVYSGVLTAVFAATILGGLWTRTQKAKFDQIDVQRINVWEPDGTLRMVISDKARFPGLIIRGKEYPHPRSQAGMLFFNDEGTENGGLIFGGYRDKDGKIIDSGGSLSFDQYEQDQIVQIEGSHDSTGHFAGLVVFAGQTGLSKKICRNLLASKRSRMQSVRNCWRSVRRVTITVPL